MQDALFYGMEPGCIEHCSSSHHTHNTDRGIIHLWMCCCQPLPHWVHVSPCTKQPALFFAAAFWLPWPDSFVTCTSSRSSISCTTMANSNCCLSWCGGWSPAQHWLRPVWAQGRILTVSTAALLGVVGMYRNWFCIWVRGLLQHFNLYCWVTQRWHQAVQSRTYFSKLLRRLPADLPCTTQPTNWHGRVSVGTFLQGSRELRTSAPFHRSVFIQPAVVATAPPHCIVSAKKRCHIHKLTLATCWHVSICGGLVNPVGCHSGACKSSKALGRSPLFPISGLCRCIHPLLTPRTALLPDISRLHPSQRGKLLLVLSSCRGLLCPSVLLLLCVW